MICQAPLDQAEQQETSSFVHTGFETVCGMTLRSASCLASRVCYVDSTREHVTRRVVRCPEDVPRLVDTHERAKFRIWRLKNGVLGKPQLSEVRLSVMRDGG